MAQESRAKNNQLRQGGVRTLWLYVLLGVLFFPVLLGLYVLRARWYGWAVFLLSLGAMIWVLRKKLWYRRRMLLCLLLCFLLALTGLYASRPRMDVSFQGQLTTGLLSFILELPLDESVRSGSLFSDVKSLWQPPEGYGYREATWLNVRMELLTAPDNPDHRLVIQYHGGAFVAGLNDMYRSFAVQYSHLAGNADVLTVDYRLAPEYPYPTQQIDAMTAWTFATRALGYEPAKIVLAGDSAGGNLALYMGLRLRDTNQALPAAIAAFSPWADLSNSGPSHVYNARLDPNFGIGGQGDYDGPAIGVSTAYTDGHDPADPYMSPSYGDYTGLCPILLQAGSIEVLLSDSEMVKTRCDAVGTPCTLTVYTGMFHVFQALMDMTPESKAAWAEYGAFAQKALE